MKICHPYESLFPVLGQGGSLSSVLELDTESNTDCTQMQNLRNLMHLGVESRGWEPLELQRTEAD